MCFRLETATVKAQEDEVYPRFFQMKSQKSHTIESNLERPLTFFGEKYQMNCKAVHRKKLQILFLVFVVASGAMLTACKITAFRPGLSGDPDPTPNSPMSPGSISGTVWRDICDRSDEGEKSDPKCVFDAARDLYLANGIFEEDENGLPGIQVSLGKGLCPSRGVGISMSGDDGSYSFDNLSPGYYCITVDFPGAFHQAKPVSGAWTYPKSESGIGVNWISISLSEGENYGEVNFGWDFLIGLSQPEPEPTIAPPIHPTCSNKATFIEDVTVIDGDRFSQGEEFSKIWRLKNVGTCVWNGDYSLVFASGDQMSGPAAQFITEEVPSGDEIDVIVSLKASEDDGTYKGYWMLQSSSGEVFGIGTDADKPFWVVIAVGKEIPSESVVSWNYELDPENLANEGRWVDVDLGQQLLTAYEGSTPIMRFIVSTGTASHPTVTGQFRIWVKLASTDMSGPGYSLEDVPYTMYFYQGYGLHGTYWHNNFGTPMSHGCVNLRTPDAEWLFNFVSEGTLVNVHL